MEDKREFFKVDSYINDMASTGKIESFYPQTISRKLNIPLDVTISELMKCVSVDKLHLKYEIRCLDDLTTLEVVDSLDDIIDCELECYMCGEEFKVTYSNVYLKFFIDEDLIEELKKKQQLK